MNNITKSLIFLSAAALVALPSCSLFNKSQASKPTSVSVLPQDREQIQKQASLHTYSPEELSRGIVRGDWSIETVNGKTAVGEKAPYLMFEPTQNRVYGSNGCNTLNADYKYNPQDSTISFSQMVTTMRACAMEGITDYEINHALNNTRRYSWKLGENDTYYLYFYDAHGIPLMTLMHQNFAFLNGTWRVVTIDDQPVDVPDMKLVIDIDEGKVHGNTGCNIINGTIETDMDQPNSISLQDFQMTRMACPDMNYETRLLVALEGAAKAKAIEKDKVLFINDQNQVVLTLVRANDK